MVGVGVEKKLYDAASRGDLATFQQLLQGDPYLLHGVSFAGSRNLLHIATIWEQPAIVEEVLRIHPQLAEEFDSQNSSPLHIAAAKGYVRIASQLLSVAPHMCWSRDCQGMNPVHIAAMNGQVEILKELIEADPFPAREKVGGGQTVIHLCVKHRQLRALQVLADNLGELVDEGDDNGDTVLHLAVRYKQVEIIQYLVQTNKIHKKSRNGKGETALQTLSESPDIHPHTTTTSQIREILGFDFAFIADLQRLTKLSDFMIVVVILVATMAFQAAVSPPGGLWQEDSSLHKAGEAVMASNHPEIYKHFIRANTVAFASSMTAIIMLATNLPSENVIAMSLTFYAVWVSLASIAVSYGASVMVITPHNTQTPSFRLVINTVITVCLVPYGIIMIGVCLLVTWKRLERRFPWLKQTRTRFWVNLQAEIRARYNFQATSIGLYSS